MKKAIKIGKAILLFVLVFCSINYMIDNSILEYENKSLQEANEWKQERLIVYLEITRRQDEIIMKNKGSRLQKSEDQELLEITQKLY